MTKPSKTKSAKTKKKTSTAKKTGKPLANARSRGSVAGVVARGGGGVVGGGRKG